MAAIIDEYLDGSVDNDDVFPCKGCGEILEEGKAFELAGNRWHLDCFRCNTCGTLLDSDANLLLLGDGSLICNNCTYSCSACGNKIEDLAILTGEQAFCSTCFRCRNCKRKIENLRYARTSQGIFCMGCHETLMARRRKKSKAAAAAKAREKDHSPMVKEKSLPALPPSAIPPNAFSEDRVDPDSDTPTETSPRPQHSQPHTEPSSRGSSRPTRSPERRSEASRNTESLSLPATTYRKNRNSAMAMSHDSNTTESADSFYIPVAFDPSPGTGTTPRSTSEHVGDSRRKDYFGNAKPSSSDKRSDSHSSTPHIAFQEKGRQPSSDYDTKPPSRKLSKSSAQDQSKSPAVNEKSQRPAPSRSQPSSDALKLQDRTKQLMESRSSSQSSVAHDNSASRTTNGTLPTSDSRRANENMTASRGSVDSRRHEDAHSRASMDSASHGPSRPDHGTKAIPRKEVPSTARNVNDKTSRHSRSATDDTLSTSRQAAGRTGLGDQKNANDNYMLPRSAPAPPGAREHKESISSTDDQEGSPKQLPRWSSGGDFTMQEDMARILGTDEHSSSILRRVSHAARHSRASSESGASLSRVSHTRSISETTRATASPRWPKPPVTDVRKTQQHDIGSPLSMASADDPALLKRQLRNSEQRVAELERQFNTENDLKSLNKKLIEKRKTVSVLDTQTEIMIKQLEVLAGYVEKAKETKTPIDIRELEDSAIKEFVQKLERVKIAMSEGIEQLHEERDKLVDEKKQAMDDRDRALMEFEQLSSKNAQLADMNNDLTQQLQGRFKSQMGGDVKSPNGLGIYSQNRAGSSANLDNASITTGAATLVAADEEPIVETGGPTVVQVRKGQVKKFNWKKGSKGLAHGVAKGVNRAVVAFQNERDRPQHMMAGDSIGMPYNTTVAAVESPAGTPTAATQPGKQQAEAARQGFGFFGKKAAVTKSASALAIVPDVAEPPSVLFGSELSERAEFERRQIPNIVTRCIEEVELRGMDQEGIYRKTGGNSQVNMIKDGLDKSEDFDIADPDLDITAVTSVLKQYFRKLPNPLLTFDVYDRILESNAVADEKERCVHLRKTFSSMPQPHQDCLEFLMFHLDRVAQRESENLMTPKNLSVVFAPTIMRDLNIEREMTDMHAKNLAVQFIIEKSKIIFDDDA